VSNLLKAGAKSRHKKWKRSNRYEREMVYQYGCDFS